VLENLKMHNKEQNQSSHSRLFIPRARPRSSTVFLVDIAIPARFYI
jgi:hypothetical protein